MNGRRFQFDDDAQVDGDDSGRANFNPIGGGQPWLRQGTPPWHQWGTLERVTARSGIAFTTPITISQQLCRVSYKRPETFNWLFYARIIEGTDAGLAEQGSVVVNFDVMVGLGRASVQLPGFENFSWTWGPSASAPLSVIMWSTQSRAANRVFPIPATPIDNVISELVGENIQVNARILNNSNYVNATTLEVAAFFCPKSHIRPDWFVDGPPEVAFPGDEIAGR